MEPLVILVAIVLLSHGVAGDSPVYVPPHAVDSLDQGAAPSRQQRDLAARQPPAPRTDGSLPTVTVRGFLNFRTTVDGTVIVFTPASSSAAPNPGGAATSANQQPAIERTQAAQIVPTSSSIQQTSEFIRPTSTQRSPTATLVAETDPPRPSTTYPTVVVTVVGGTVVAGGATTVYETRVIGTYIDGKYAQIVKSTSHIKGPAPLSPTFSNIAPTRVLYDQPTSIVATKISTSERFGEDDVLSPQGHQLEVKDNSLNNFHRVTHPLQGNEAIQSSRAISIPPSRLQGLRGISVRGEGIQVPAATATPDPAVLGTAQDDEADGAEINPLTKIRRPTRIGTRRFTLPPRQSPRVRLNRFKVKVVTQTPPTSTPNARDREKEEAARIANNRLQARIGELRPARHQRVDSDKEVRHHHNHKPANNNHEIRPSASSDFPVPIPQSLDPHLLPISPARVKEVQAITTEVTQHLNGEPINVDTVTHTSTLHRTLHPSEFEPEGLNLNPSVNPNNLDERNDLEPPVSATETPPLTVISRTYSVTERSMRTQLVPVFDGSETVTHTVTESFFIRKLITAYKTMPPGDVLVLETGGPNSFNSTLDQAEQGLEPSIFTGFIPPIEATNLPDDDNLLINPSATSLTDGQGLQTLDPNVNPNQPQQFTPPNNLPFGNFDLNNPLILAAALQNPQIALAYLNLQAYKSQAEAQGNFGNLPLQARPSPVDLRPTTVIHTQTYVTTDTQYATRVVSFYDGRSTRTRTIQDPTTRIERTVTSLSTEIIQPTATAAAANQITGFTRNPFLSQSQPLNPLQGLIDQQSQFRQQFNQQQFNQQQAAQIRPTVSVITSSFTTVTEATATNTKVYTLIYNAFSTRFRTVTSTSVYPTTVTTFTTTTVPILNTQAIFG